MPVREKSYLRAILAGHRWDCVTTDQSRLGIRHHLSSGVLEPYNRQRIQIPPPQIVAFCRRGLCQRGNYLFWDLCHCKALQYVPQRWQLFFSPTGITGWAIVRDAPAPLPVSPCTLWPLGPLGIQALSPASCSMEVSSSSLWKPQRETSL